MSRFRQAFKAALGGRPLSLEEAAGVLEGLVSGEADDVTVAAFLGALSARAPTAEELAGFAGTMRRLAVRIDVARRPLIDTCGTGGDGLSTFNFSTAAAFVAVGGGVAVAKHGNRAVSSRCGSADVLAALGVPVDLGPAAAARAIGRAGFAFLMAPRYHPAMRRVAEVRARLGVRTVFNLLGPLANPAGVRRQVVGVPEPSLAPIYASALGLLGAERALVVAGLDGMDELTLAGRTLVCHVEGEAGIRIEELAPEDVELRRASPEDLRGGDAAGNARILEEALSGRPGAVLDGVLLNAAAAFVAAGSAPGIRDGVALARETVASGRALRALDAARAPAAHAVAP